MAFSGRPGTIRDPCYRQNPLSPVKRAAVSDSGAISGNPPLIADTSLREAFLERLFHEPLVASDETTSALNHP